MSADRLEEKFTLLAGRALVPEQLAELSACLAALEEQPDLTVLGRLLVPRVAVGAPAL